KGRFMLRPEGLLAPHRQGLLLSSFRRLDRSKPASRITTRANSQFPRPDLHRQETRHYGLRAKAATRERAHRMTISTRITRVSPSPSKIPYGGVSPVRLQKEILPPPSASRQEVSAARIPPANKPYKRPKSKHPAHAPHRRASRSRPSTLGPSGTIAGSTGRFRPEALGSPTGYIVPSDHRLLWPHPSLSSPSTHLFIRGWLLQPWGLPRVENKRFPNLLLVSIPSCRPPYPDGPNGCLWLCFTVGTGLRRLCKGSASTVPTRFGTGAGKRNEAARFALCYGPKGCLPPTDRGFYFRAFAGWIAPSRRRE